MEGLVNFFFMNCILVSSCRELSKTFHCRSSEGL